MAGLKNNTITYVFEGDTLNLEQAIKRVQSLMRGTVKTLKEQEGGMSEVEKAQYKQLRSLMKTIKTLQEKTVSLTDEEKKQLNNAMKKALQISNRLHNAKLKVKDKERREEARRHQKDVSEADKQAKELEEARSPEAQVRAHSQVQQLSRLKGFMNIDDPTEKEALQNLEAVIAEYKSAKQAYDEGTGSMSRLAAATVALNEKYKELAGSLNRLSSEQTKANHGEGKSSFLQFILGKTKSLTVYKLIKAVLAKIVQATQQALQKIAQKNRSFNDAMSRITSSFQLMSDKIATVLAPVLQLLVPLFESVANVIGIVTDKLAEMFSAIAGNDAWAKATYQVQDYIEAVKKTKQPEGIDELNKLNNDQNNIVNVDIDSKFSGLKALGDEIKKIFELISNTFGPVLQPLTESLAAAFQLIGSLVTALEPLFMLVSSILALVSGAVGGVLTFLIEKILMPIVEWLAYIISHLELLIPLVTALIALFAATHWATFVTSLKAIALGFVNVAKSIVLAIKNLVVWIAKTVIAKVKSLAMAAANMWEAMTWWQKAIAIIAAGGVAAVAVLGVVMAATATGNSAAESALNNNYGVEAAMATGGIVAAPTIALLGEGHYPEAVVPLGQSPQFTSMKQGIAEEVASMIGNNGRGSTVSDRPVILNIDGKTLARAMWPNLINTQYQVGVKLK